MAKLGAMTTPTPGASSTQRRTVAILSASKPVVPTTQWMPSSMHQRMLSSTTSGWVKSTTTCAPASATLKSQSPASTIATRSRSSAASTARQASLPIRPRAPSTPTRNGSSETRSARRRVDVGTASGRRVGGGGRAAGAVSAEPVGPGGWLMTAP